MSEREREREIKIDEVGGERGEKRRKIKSKFEENFEFFRLIFLLRRERKINSNFIFLNSHTHTDTENPSKEIN